MPSECVTARLRRVGKGWQPTPPPGAPPPRLGEGCHGPWRPTASGLHCFPCACGRPLAPSPGDATVNGACLCHVLCQLCLPNQPNVLKIFLESAQRDIFCTLAVVYFVISCLRGGIIKTKNPGFAPFFLIPKKGEHMRFAFQVPWSSLAHILSKRFPRFPPPSVCGL